MEMDNDVNINLESSTMSDVHDDSIPKRKISVRQLMILFFFATVSGITRIAVSLPSEKIHGEGATKAVWLAPFAAVIPVLILALILDGITKKYTEKSLAQIIEMILGKIFGKIVLFAFFAHIILYISFYVRNFAEKFISSIFTEIAPSFFIIILLLFSVFAARRNIESFARFSEMAFILTAVIFIPAFLISVFQIDPKNLYPVTTYDIMPVLKASIPAVGLFSLLTLSLFLGDNVTREKANPDIFKKTSTKFIFFLILFNLAGTVAVSGTFSHETVPHMSMPYFMMFKTIKTTGLIQSLETFFIIFWVFTDFIMVTYYLFVLSRVSKKLFELDRPDLFILPLVFIILILSYFIGANEFEAEYFYRNIINYSSMILGFGVPVIVLIVGKLRKIL